MISFLTSAVLLLLLLQLLVAGLRDVYRKRTSRLPPGPPSLPFLGNILDLPSKFLYRRLDSWAQRHGPIYTFWIMSQPFVVLGSVAVAADVLDRMSAATSDRPVMIKAREFYFQDMFVPLQDHTARWRAQRKSIHSNLNIRAATRFNKMQAHEAAYFTLGLLQHPDKPFGDHTHRFGGSIIFRALYGGDGIPLFGPDPSKRIGELMDEGARVSMPQASLVDTLPFLKPVIQRVKWLRRSADRWFAETSGACTPLYAAAAATDAWNEPTIVQDLNTNMEKYGVTNAEAPWMALALFMAGQDTTNNVLRVATLAMLHHPQVMETAQAQLDAVCGERLPTYEDSEQLPYIQAIIKEALRWKVGVPLSLPHRVSEDFEYLGYTIPKGTVIFDNLWSQTRDLSVYSSPESFDPTRFLDASGALRPVTADTRLDQLGFGHGRRVCPGRDFAINSLFIGCAYMLWAFRLEWPVDANGEKIVCGVDDFEDKGTVVAPTPFNVAFKPRKEGLEERLMAAMKG